MKVFVSNLRGHVGSAVRTALLEAEHEVVGTIAAGEESPGKVAETAEIGSTEAEDLALAADAVIVTLEGDLRDANAVVSALRRATGDAERVVIGVSTVLTWARCPQPADGEKFSEADYKRRKPGPKHAEYKTLESYIMNLGREGLRSHILAAGILYGGGEDLLHSLVKRAWICEDEALPVPSSSGGENALPLLHVNDAAKLAVALLDNAVDSQYLVAVDQASSTLAEVTAAISTALGPGTTRAMTEDEASEAMITDPALPSLQVNLAFDADSLAISGLGIEWTSQEGLVENAAAVAAEYVAARKLTPVRVAVLGPPASGKSALAAALAKKYYVPHITAAAALATVREQESELATAVNEAVEAAAGGHIGTVLFCRAVRSVLEAPQLRNRGYILDGLPRTFREARLLFAEVAEDEPEEEGKGDEEPAVNLEGASLPAVIALSGDEAVFAARVRAIPQAQVEGTHNTEEGYRRRLAAYTAANSPEDPKATVVFFEKHGGVETLDLAVQAGSSTESLVAAATPFIEVGGTPYNYHPTPEEVAAAKAAEEEAEAARLAEAKAAEEARVEAEAAAKAAREQQEAARKEQIAKQEAELLETRSAPLRTYLMQNVIPTLTQGLLELCKVDPEDPVDYLAEYLFKQSPTTNGAEYEAKLKASSE